MEKFRLVIWLKDGKVERKEFDRIDEMTQEARSQMFRIDLKKQREAEAEAKKDLDEKEFRLVESVSMDGTTNLYSYEDVQIFSNAIRFLKNTLFNI